MGTFRPVNPFLKIVWYMHLTCRPRSTPQTSPTTPGRQCSQLATAPAVWAHQDLGSSRYGVLEPAACLQTTACLPACRLLHVCRIALSSTHAVFKSLAAACRVQAGYMLPLLGHSQWTFVKGQKLLLSHLRLAESSSSSSSLHVLPAGSLRNLAQRAPGRPTRVGSSARCSCSAAAAVPGVAADKRPAAAQQLCSTLQPPLPQDLDTLSW